MQRYVSPTTNSFLFSLLLRNEDACADIQRLYLIDLVEWLWQQIQQLSNSFLVLSEKADDPSRRQSSNHGLSATVAYSRLGMFLVQLGERISSNENLLSSELHQWLKTLFSSLPLVCKFGLFF
jgi:hypothetical protein